MACITFEGKEYSINEFKAALLNGEFERLHNEGKLSLPESQKLFTNIKPQENAVQKQSTGEILQREPEETGKAGSERVGMEQGKQREETTGTRTEEKEQIAEKSISEKGKELADKIRQLRVRKGSQAYATIFGLPIAIYDTALVTIANAVELTADLSQAINEGVNYIKSKVKDWEDDGGHFAKHIEDFIEGKKPKLKVQVEAEKNEIEPTDEEAEKQKTKEAKKEIDNYDLTSSNETNKFLSGETWEDVFGEKPEGNQNYVVQKLTDMLQDGKNMIAVAQQKWGTDIMEYGKKLFSYIQNMERVSSNAETNKKAVLLATFLGEIKEAIINEPDRANEIRKLEAAVLDYYQHYMNVKGKQVVAGRLLRLYRDKYLGDVFASRILEDQQVKEKEAIQSAEKNVKVDDDIAQKTNAPVTEEENKKEEKAEKKRKEDSDKKQASKKSMSTKEAQQKANDKLKEIEQKLGKEKDKGLIAKINDLINKLNCP